LSSLLSARLRFSDTFRAGFKCVEAQGRIITGIRCPYPPPNAIIIIIIFLIPQVVKIPGVKNYKS